MQRLLVGLGALWLVLGLAWPLNHKLGLGRLPGDILFQREGFRFYLPLTSMLLPSARLSLLLRLLRK